MTLRRGLSEGRLRHCVFLVPGTTSRVVLPQAIDYNGILPADSGICHRLHGGLMFFRTVFRVFLVVTSFVGSVILLNQPFGYVLKNIKELYGKILHLGH